MAHALHVQVPIDLSRHKGWVGGLLERALGATAGSRSAPDFEALGVELKTIPISRTGRPRESTFLTSIAPRTLADERWPTSTVRSKLARVLWVPIEASPDIPLGRRRVGSPLLWSPSAEEDRALSDDFELLRRSVSEGWLDGVTAHAGQFLQVRPKGKNAAARRWTPDPDGDESPARPRGFYLRARFTAGVLARHYHPASLS